jgi:hypothetical protein
MAENETPKDQKIFFSYGESPNQITQEDLAKSLTNSYMGKAIEKHMGKHEKTSAPRIAFTEDPLSTYNWAGIYKIKNQLLPDDLIKRIRLQNHLIASILRARSNTMSLMAHIKHDRFDVGVQVSIKAEFENIIKEDQAIKINERIARFEKLLVNCGKTDGLKESEKMNLTEFFYRQTMDGLSIGWFATELIYEEENGERQKLHRFRPVDSSSIRKTVKDGEEAQDVRQLGLQLLRQLTNEKIDAKAFEENNYAWVQVISGAPKQAFTEDELIVTNLFPCNEIEFNGYPVTPIDTTLSSVTTHISIDSYNRLYFQNGRAAKGMLVINSEDIDQQTVNVLKQEFVNSINNVGNSFRVPVFGVGEKDRVTWVPMVTSSGDGEFQFLYDNVARAILTAFGMSPDELPGMSHLSRGTNQQSLSESSNEFKLTAARDVGLRPLITKFQSFLNETIFPLLDPELSQICTIKVSGLDAQNREQEAVRLQQESPLHMTYDEIMTQTDKSRVGSRMGGNFPMNERLQVILDKYSTVGELLDSFFHDPTALADPLLRYRRDPFFIQAQNLIMQVNPAALKAYYATRPYAIDILKMVVQDYLDEDEP